MKEYLMTSLRLYFTVATAPTDLMVRQTGSTSIRVTWTPPDPLGNTTGYMIYYSTDTDSGNVTASASTTDEYTLKNLERESEYTISIVAASAHLPSESVIVSIMLVSGTVRL